MDALRNHPAIYRALRFVRMRSGSLLGARHVHGIPGKVHYNDTMAFSAGDHYIKTGENVIAILQESLSRCGTSFTGLSSVLEIGSGYGRIMRHLVKHVPPARIAVCDVVDEGPRFCAREFGVRAMPSDLSAIASGFDLIYLISVFTHLDHETIAGMLSQIEGLLNPRGVLVFTTQGFPSAAMAEVYGEPWRTLKQQIQAELASHGYFYKKYPWHKENIGMTWISEGFIHSLTQLRFVGFEPGQLDTHQDVYTFVKN